MKTAQAFLIALILLTVPTTVHAAPLDFVNGVWDYPSRSASEIASWVFGTNVAPTPAAQILGVKDLTGAPIIEESVVRPDLGVKLDSTGSSLEKLYLDYQLVLSETVLIGLNWDSLTVSDVTAAIDKQNSVLANSSQILDSLSRAWGWAQTDAIKTQINSTKTGLATVRTITSTSGMLPVAYDQLKSTVKEIEGIISLVGAKTDTKAKNSLYGKYNEVHEQASAWDELLAQLEAQLAAGDTTNLAKLEARVMSLNQIPHVSTLLSKDAKNRVLGLIAVANANKTLLAQDRGLSITSTWLEQAADGNIIFKTLVVNPSVLARQEISVKYYLPAEIQEQDVVKFDPSLQIKLDPTKKQVFVEGDIVVAANDARTVTLESKDIWNFDHTTLDAIRLQTDSLVDSMAGLPSFVQAVALKGNIYASLNKISALQTTGGTPEQKIKAYRQTALLQEDVNNNLGRLQLLAQTDSTGSLPEFVAWKELAIMVGGAVFALMGLGMLRSPNQHLGHGRRSKTKLEHINIFTTSGVNTSDL